MPDRLSSHRIPLGVFDALARGHGGRAAGLLLAEAERSKHLLLVEGLAAAGAAGPGGDRIHAAHQILLDLHRRAPAAVESVLTHPAVGCWALRTLQRLRHGEPADTRKLAAVAAAAAVRAGVSCAVTVPVEGGTSVLLPSLGRALFDPRPADAVARGEALVRVTASGAEVVGPRGGVRIPADPTQDAHGWQGLRGLTAGSARARLHVLIDDLDPYRFPSAEALAPRLAPDEVVHWRSTLAQGWLLLERDHSHVTDEVRAMVSVLTPLRADRFTASSATSRRTFGSVALSRPQDARSLALAFAHEIQHAKLAALLDLVDLIDPDQPGGTTLYYAPWREDPRPLAGLLQGAYAHLGVAGFWRRQRHREQGDRGLAANTEFVRWRDATVETVEVIAASCRLTRLGDRFVTGMRHTLRSWQDDPVPAQAEGLARQAALGHRRRWSRGD